VTAAEASATADAARADAAAASGAPSTAADAAPAGAASQTPGPLSADQIATIRAGYTFDGPALEMGALVNGDARPDVPVRIPVGMMNRHGLVAGATGTGKTKTLQVLAEQLSALGVPVFAADIKGDLSGVASPGAPNDKLLARTRGIGQDWAPAAAPTEYFSLGGIGAGVPIRATVSGFGPLLLSKVLGLNDTQESSLGLVFHYAAKAGLPLVDLADLRAVLSYLTTAEGKVELRDLGGLSAATVGVILRELITFADDGADVFFGEPEIDTGDFLRVASDGRGIISLLEVPGVHDKPALFSTFLMWLLADLFNDLPEVGDIDKPKLVFFFDEAHLLFTNASKDFLTQITQTVRLIRSKGVGIFFVTQTPKDVPNDVLAQVGSRIQHQLRAHTPDDAKALRSTVSTYPTSGYELGEVLQQLATGEAIVTVMNEKGAPSPVAWTRLRAPQGSMSPTPAAEIEASVRASALLPKYGAAVDRESAHELLTRKMDAAAAAERAAAEAGEKADAQKQAQAEYDRMQREWKKSQPKATSGQARRAPAPRAQKNPLEDFLGSSAGRSVVKTVVQGIFGTLRRR
jgi:DNA helicase HerA-like ATPase